MGMWLYEPFDESNERLTKSFTRQGHMVLVHDPKALHGMLVKEQEHFPKGLAPVK